jgi:CARDB
MGTRGTRARKHVLWLLGGTILILAPAGPAAGTSAAATQRAELVPSPPMVVSGDARPMGTVRLSMRVVNRGTRSARPTVGEVVFSTDMRRDGDDTVLRRVTLPALRPRRPHRASVVVRLPAELTGAGLYRVILCVDAAGAVAEADEGNNCSQSRHLPLPPPPPPPEPKPGAPVTVSECGGLPAPTAPAEAFTAMWQRSGPGWTGGDGELSVPLPDGRVAWLFADTFIGGIVGDRRPAGARLVRNVIVLQDAACLTTVFGGTREEPQALVARGRTETGGPETWYWPASGFVQDGELRVLYYRMVGTNADVFPFRFDGTDLARFALPDLRPMGVEPLTDEANPAWGGAVVDAGAHTYVFGIRGDGLRSLLHVARTPRGRLGEAPLEYWDGAGWRADSRGSREVADDVTTTSFLVDEAGWTLVTQDQLFGENVTVRRAPAPEGPWGPKTVIARAPAPPGGYSYGAAIHPELGGDRSNMLVSYSVNGWKWDDVLAWPDLYRPRFLRVDLREPPAGVTGAARSGAASS